MPASLYEALGVAEDATPEEIRKAYRKKALQTHPDRLPPGATAVEKSQAEEQFRIANNAYEVLSDVSKRRAYDHHGVWPPPEPQEEQHRRSQHGHHHHHHHHPHPQAHQHRRRPHHRRHGDLFAEPFPGVPFVDPFDARPRFAHTAFTDPFTLFNSIFGEINRRFHEEPVFADSFPPPPIPPPLDYARNRQRHHSHRQGPFPEFDRIERTSTFPILGLTEPIFAQEGPRRHSGNYEHASHRERNFRSGGSGGHWVVQEQVIQTVNGVTRKKLTRRDADGNEHITYSFPDCRERHLINGIEKSYDRVQPPLPYSSAHSPTAAGPYHAYATAACHEAPREREIDQNRHLHHYNHPSRSHSHSKKRWWHGHW